MDNYNIVLIDSSTLYPNYEYLNNISIVEDKPFISDISSRLNIYSYLLKIFFISIEFIGFKV